MLLENDVTSPRKDFWLHFADKVRQEGAARVDLARLPTLPFGATGGEASLAQRLQSSKFAVAIAIAFDHSLS